MQHDNENPPAKSIVGATIGENIMVSTGNTGDHSSNNETTNNGGQSLVARTHYTTQETNLFDPAQAIAASTSSYNLPASGTMDEGGVSADAVALAAAAVDNHKTTSTDEEATTNNVGMFDPTKSELVPRGELVPNNNLIQEAQMAMTKGWLPRSKSPPMDRTQYTNDLLEQQKQATTELTNAEQDFERAKQRLVKAKQVKMNIDELVKVNEENATEKLLNVNTSWNQNYKRLLDFKQEHGHCHVLRNPKRSKTMTSTEKELMSLGSWVGQVRKDAKRSTDDPEKLEPYKVAALDRIGFDWEPRENYWHEMCEQLKVYLKNNNGKMPPRFINNQKFALGQWCDTQLDNYRNFKAGKRGKNKKKGYITQEKIDVLNEIGFVWDKRGQLWKDNYEKLKTFKAEQGHCNATAANNGGDKTFGTWVTKQKRKYTNYMVGEETSLEHTLTDDQAALLDAIEFGDCVKIDGRKRRLLNEQNRNQNANTGSMVNLVNASEEILGQSANINVQQQEQGQQEHGTQHALDEQDNNQQQMDPYSGNSSVAMLVDAMLESQSATAYNGWKSTSV